MGQLPQVCGDVSILALQPDRSVRPQRRPVEPAISVRGGDLLLQSGETQLLPHARTRCGRHANRECSYYYADLILVSCERTVAPSARF